MSRFVGGSAAPNQRLHKPDGTMIRALVVDDEPALRELLSLALRYEGWDARTAEDGHGALALIRDFHPDVIVLDVMLPDINGLQILRRIQTDGNTTPVLFLTANDSLEDRIAGLTQGGDDYVTKPFSLEEVVARIRGLIRRSTHAVPDSPGSSLTVGELSLDEDAREVIRAGDRIVLTCTEFDLLHYFMQNPKRVLTKTQILEHVWGFDFGGRSSIVEIYVSYLRKKIDAGREPMIHTLRGVGYMLKVNDKQVPAEADDHEAAQS